MASVLCGFDESWEYGYTGNRLAELRGWECAWCGGDVRLKTIVGKHIEYGGNIFCSGGCLDEWLEEGSLASEMDNPYDYGYGPEVYLGW